MITICCLPQVSFQWLTHVQAAMSTLQKPGIGTFSFRFHPPKYASSLGWCNSNSTAAATSDRAMQEYLLHLSNPTREGTARSVLAALIIVVSNLCLPTPIGLLSRPVHAQPPASLQLVPHHHVVCRHVPIHFHNAGARRPLFIDRWSSYLHECVSAASPGSVSPTQLSDTLRRVLSSADFACTWHSG